MFGALDEAIAKLAASECAVDIAELHRRIEKLEALWLREIAAQERSGEWAADGYTSSAAWLRDTCRLTRGDATAAIKSARTLAAMPALADAYETGAITRRHVQVVSLARTPHRAGAFVDLDGMDGLIHISELSWSHVNHPSEILSIGDTVSVKVLDIDRQRQRISLGLKQTQEDPWQRVVDTYNIGDELEGNVTKVVTFGAFVEILPGTDGLVHISELDDKRVNVVRDICKEGDEMLVKVIGIDRATGKIRLSRREAMGKSPDVVHNFRTVAS